MTPAMEFDIGPLTWVKNEIDLALARSDEALGHYIASVASSGGDLTQIKFCRTHLHQVQGALTIIGLDGVTQFVETLEAMLEMFEQQQVPPSDSSISLARRALVAIGQYLGDLINGQPNQPLRLFSLYREIQAERGVPCVSAVDLFSPDLSIVPPRREMPMRKLEPAGFRKFLKQERNRFQRGLLAWLRAPRDHQGIGGMVKAVRRIEETQESASARAFWWIASGFLTALAEGGLPEEGDAKQLCARIDLQIRRLIEGSRNVAGRLMRDALYLVANAQSDNTIVREIKRAYRLDMAIATGKEAVTPAAEEALLSKLHDVLTALEEAWNKFCAGSPKALQVFKEKAQALSAIVGQLRNGDYPALARSIVAVSNWLTENPSRHSDIVAMEIATAVLLAQNAQQNYSRLDENFAHQVTVIEERIRACIAGKPILSGSEIPLLDEMSRRAQEKLLLSQVAKEIQNNFAQIEQVLDNFFRDPSKRSDLDSLDDQFRQISGALTMLHQEAVVAELQGCREKIQRFSDPEYEPEEVDFEHVANQLSMIGFFVEAMPQGAVDYAAFVRRMQTSEPELVEAEKYDDSVGLVEQEVAQNKRETLALLGALKEQPEDVELRREIRQNLETLRHDADLVADIELGEQTKAVLSALENGENAVPQIEQAMAVFKPEPAISPMSSQETLQLSKASREEIDAELLGIFLEEAKEVLATISENLLHLRSDAGNVEFLTTIRRSFHTLKGSGRMVGLKDVGEAAWAIEQTLNQWLRLEQDVSPALFELLDQASTLFSAWVKYLEAPEGDAPDPTNTIAFAEALRSGQEQGQTIILPPEAELTTTQTSMLSMTDDDALQEFVSERKFESEEVQPSAEVIQVDFASMPVPDDEGPVVEESLSEEEDSLAEMLPLTVSVYREAETEVVAPVPVPEVFEAEVESPKAERQEGIISPMLFEIFFNEAKGHLRTLQREAAVLESEEIVATPDELCRAAHTLAGISATVGLMPINRLSHALELALLRRDQAEQPQSLHALGVINRAIGELELMFSALLGKQAIEAPNVLIEELTDLYPPGALIATAPIPPSDELSAPPPEIPSVTLVTEEPPTEAARPQWEDLLPAPSSDPAIPSLVDEIDEQLLPIFLEEAVDINQGIATQLRSWRANLDHMEAVPVLARLLHTLKGSARMAGAMNLGEITHALESRVDQVSQSGEVTPEVIDEIENTFESIQQIIDRMRRGESLDHSEPVPLPTVETSSYQPQTAVIDTPYRAPAERPVIEDLQPDNDEVMVESDLAQQAMLRVRANVIDRLVNGAGELSIARSRIEGEMRGLKKFLLDLTENVIRLRRQLREIEIQAETQMQSRVSVSHEKHTGFDPLEFDRFTRFQELTRMMAESVNDVSTVQQSLLKNLDDANAAIAAQARLNREVQQELMAVRMEPFSGLAERMYRVVRQTAKELNKRANLEIRGTQVELDRSVLDKIVAPLEHMLRNAVAHGIESRKERIARGKPEVGEISLSLRQEGNEVVIIMADDGAGLNYERIRDRGIAAGLLQADEEVSQERLAELVFTSGFSTAEDVSRIAGRGVGMDVVKTEVRALGGRAEISSLPGQGTELRLIIPLTLAVTKALLIRAGSKIYAIPSSMVEQVIDLKEAALNRIRDAGSAEWMGHQYPFSYLPHLLGEPASLPEQHRQYWVLMLRSGSRRVSILVDELQGNREIVVKNIGLQLARAVGVDGATVLGDGQVVLILNPVALSTRLFVPSAATTVSEEALETTLSPPEVSAVMLPTVMVVDDSLTVRKITGRLLEREGYQVLTAKDGVEAIEQLHDAIPDVMLVDIEMPRMDGFDLTMHIRADDRLKDIPIIMVTSRMAEKHRAYAFEIGVDHYLGKPYQEDELLQLVAKHAAQRRQIS